MQNASRHAECRIHMPWQGLGTSACDPTHAAPAAQTGTDAQPTPVAGPKVRRPRRRRSPLPPRCGWG
jgi:hypothetical protein